MSVAKYTVFEEESVVDSMLSEIFEVIEGHYIGRSVYEADMLTLSRRVSALEALSEVTFTIDNSTGNLILSVPDNGDEVNISIVDDNVVLVSNKTNTDLILERYSFTINNSGYLMLTFT